MHDRNTINKINTVHQCLAREDIYHPEAKEYGAFCNIESGFYSVYAIQAQPLWF